MVKLGGSVLLQVLNKVLKLAARLVLDGLLILTGEEIKSRESLNIKTLNINLVGSGIHLGDDNTVDSGELITQLVPGGGKLLAMSAPGSVKLDKDILVVVHDNVVERGTLENLDISGSILGGNSLRLESGLELAGKNGIDVSGDGIGIIEASRVGELLHGGARAHVNKNKCGECGDAEVLSNLGLAGGHVDSKNGSLEGLGNTGEDFHKRGMMVSLGISEEKGMLLDSRGKNLLGSSLRKGLHERGGLGRDESSGSLGIEGGTDREISALIIEGLEDNNRVTGKRQMLLDGVSRRNTVLQKLISGSQTQESLGRVGGNIGEITDYDSISRLLKSKDIIGSGKSLGRGARLLLHPTDNITGSAATIVLHLVSVLEEDQSGESLDIKASTGVLGDSGINLGKLGSLGGKSSGGGGVLRGQTLAMSAPGGIKLNKQKLMLSEGIIEVIISENQHTLLSGECESGVDEPQEGHKEVTGSFHFGCNIEILVNECSASKAAMTSCKTYPRGSRTLLSQSGVRFFPNHLHSDRTVHLRSFFLHLLYRPLIG
jgi:hypothetical protein